MPLDLLEILAREKARRSWSWARIAKESGVSEQTLANWRSGLFPPSLLNLSKICKWLGVQPSEVAYHVPASDNRIKKLSELVKHLSLDSIAAIITKATSMGIEPNQYVTRLLAADDDNTRNLPALQIGQPKPSPPSRNGLPPTPPQSYDRRDLPESRTPVRSDKDAPPTE